MPQMKFYTGLHGEERMEVDNANNGLLKAQSELLKVCEI
jgi:hypothetical protein